MKRLFSMKQPMVNQHRWEKHGDTQLLSASPSLLSQDISICTKEIYVHVQQHLQSSVCKSNLQANQESIITRNTSFNAAVRKQNGNVQVNWWILLKKMPSKIKNCFPTDVHAHRCAWCMLQNSLNIPFYCIALIQLSTGRQPPEHSCAVRNSLTR